MGDNLGMGVLQGQRGNNTRMGVGLLISDSECCSGINFVFISGIIVV